MNMHIPTGGFTRDEEERRRFEQRQAFDRTRLDRINDQAMARYGIDPHSANEMRSRDRGHALDQAEHVENAKASREKAAAATSSGSRLFYETQAQHTEAHAERDQHRYEAARWNTVAAREHANNGQSFTADGFQELRENRDNSLQEARSAEVEMKVRAQQLDDMKAVRDGREARDGMPAIEKAKTRQEFDARIEQIASPEYEADLREQFEQNTDAEQLEITDREQDFAPVTERSPAELDAAEAKRQPEAEQARRQRPEGESDEQQRERVTQEMTEAYDREHPGKRCQVAETRAYRIEDRVSKAIAEENGEKPESRTAKAQQAAEKAKEQQDAQRQGMGMRQ